MHITHDKYDDYISIITGYEWIEPAEKHIHTITEIINNIFPIENERDLYLSILSTGLEGRCLEKFTIANGNGRNGKGLLHDLYLCGLGNYVLIFILLRLYIIKRKFKMIHDYPYLLAYEFKDIDNNGVIKCIYKNLRKHK